MNYVGVLCCEFTYNNFFNPMKEEVLCYEHC